METMSFRFGFDSYLYYVKIIFRKNEKPEDLASNEIINAKKYNEGEKR